MLRPQSCLPGVGWPALVEPPGAQLLSVLYQLERNEWLTPDQILAEQLGQLAQLVAHARSTVPFYAQRLVDVDDYPTAQSWRAVPILTRAELQECGDALLSTASPPEHGHLGRVDTSGSCGFPVSVSKTEFQQLIWNAMTLRDFLWHERPLSGRMAAIRLFGDRAATSYPHGQIGPEWSAALRGIQQTGPCAMLDIGTSVTDQLEWLQRIDPDYLVTYPTNLRALAEAAATGAKPPRLRHLSTLGEVVDDSVREACRRAWGLRVCDIYSTAEVGYVALQCPQYERYHVQAENVYVEILDADGAPCAPGEVGNMVVTALHSFAMPLLRYAVGDLAEVGPGCECGRGAPTITRILGRAHNMAILPNGEQFWPIVNGYRFATVAPVKQWKVAQTSLHDLDVRLVVERALTPDEEASVLGLVHSGMGHPFNVTLSYHDRLERSVGGKFEDFTCEVEARVATE